MAAADKPTRKLFLVFGVVTGVSGILLMVQGNYAMGALGAILGAWLVTQNRQQPREERTK